VRWNDVRGCYSYVLFYISSIPPLSFHPLRPGLARTLTLRQMYKDKTGSIRDPLDVAREQNGSPPVRA